jgi:hypothetical protein
MVSGLLFLKQCTYQIELLTHDITFNWFIDSIEIGKSNLLSCIERMKFFDISICMEITLKLHNYQKYRSF